MCGALASFTGHGCGHSRAPPERDSLGPVLSEAPACPDDNSIPQKVTAEVFVQLAQCVPRPMCLVTNGAGMGCAGAGQGRTTGLTCCSHTHLGQDRKSKTNRATSTPQCPHVGAFPERARNSFPWKIPKGKGEAPTCPWEKMHSLSPTDLYGRVRK